MPQYKNAVLILADDWSRLAGCYGSPVIQTPNIDRFAQGAVVFNQAFCTSPSCAVSRACLLTGQHAHTHGQYGHCHGIQGFRTHAWMSSIPRDFREAGFATACIGKMHVAPAEVYPFEFVEADQRAAAMIDATTRFLAQNAQRPFYLHLGLTEPHRVGLGYNNQAAQPGITPVIYAPDEIVVPPFLPDLPAVRQDLAAYYQAVSRFDSIVGALLKVIEASGRMDETLIIVFDRSRDAVSRRQSLDVRFGPSLPVHSARRGRFAQGPQQRDDELDQRAPDSSPLVRRARARRSARTFAAADFR